MEKTLTASTLAAGRVPGGMGGRGRM